MDAFGRDERRTEPCEDHDEKRQIQSAFFLKLFVFAFLSELWNGGRHIRLEQRGGTKAKKERDRLIARILFQLF